MRVPINKDLSLLGQAHLTPAPKHLLEGRVWHLAEDGSGGGNSARAADIDFNNIRIQYTLHLRRLLQIICLLLAIRHVLVDLVSQEVGEFAVLRRHFVVIS